MAVSIDLPADQLARMKMLENILEENAINVSDRIVKIQPSTHSTSSRVRSSHDKQRRAAAQFAQREA